MLSRSGAATRAPNRRREEHPVKPMPRKKIPADLRSLARGHTELCIRVLAGIVSQEAMPTASRVSAAALLLERGWGKPQQDVAVGGDIKIVIRKMLDDDDDEPTMIDLTPEKIENKS